MSRTPLPARVVALALICFVIGGLAFVRLGSSPEAVEVPDSASTGHVEDVPCQDAPGPAGSPPAAGAPARTR